MGWQPSKNIFPPSEEVAAMLRTSHKQRNGICPPTPQQGRDMEREDKIDGGKGKR